MKRVNMGLWVAAAAVAILALVSGANGAIVRQSHPDPFIDAMLAAEHERNALTRITGFSMFFKSDPAVCFNHSIGCFTWNETGHSGNLPEDPGAAGIDMMFHLYKRGDNDSPVVMSYENETTYSGIEFLKDTSKPLYVLAHGFGGTARTFWVVDMKNALLTVQDAHVIAVDWRRGSSWPLYNQAVANTMSVGRATAFLLSEISRIYGYSPKNIHYIGFSMGAQVGGFAGRHFHQLTGEKFGRMTVLDAAAPGFEKYGVHVRKEDSAFTMAVHTSAGDSIITGKVGMITPVGHIDFYPNGGLSQPGCHFWEVKCHHEIAHHYFRESVLNSVDAKACRFKARHCAEDWKAMSKDQCTVAGDTVGEMSLTPTGDGTMYFKTNTAEPFCIPSSNDEQR